LVKNQTKELNRGPIRVLCGSKFPSCGGVPRLRGGVVSIPPYFRREFEIAPKGNKI